jgi:hypothetical protein
MRKKLVAWQGSLDAFDDLIRVRRAYYEPLLPEIDKQFRKLDAQMRLRLEQRKSLDRRLQHMLIAPRPDYLATADEQSAKAWIEHVEARLGSASGAEQDALRQRIAHLKGALIWSERTNYHQRLTDTHTHLRELNADVERLDAQYDAFVRTRQAATHSYVGYEKPIEGLRDADRGRARAHGRPPEGAGAGARGGRDPRAPGAPRAPRRLPEPGPLRVRRQL